MAERNVSRDLMFEMAKSNPYLNAEYHGLIEAPVITFDMFHSTGKPALWCHPPVPAKILVEWSTVLLGSTGFGKSNTLGRFLEQMLKYMFPFFLIDHSGEQGGLHDKEKGYPNRIIKIEKIWDGTWEIRNEGKKSEYKVKKSLGAEHSRKFIEGRISYRLDSSEFIFDDKELLFRYIYEFLKEWHRLVAQMRRDKIITHLVAVDEAHNYAPEGKVETESFKDEDLPILLKNFLVTLAAEGRKLGMPLWNITQRPAKLAKGITTQSANAILLPVNSGPDITTYQDLLTKMSEKTLLGLLAGMKKDQNRGQCFFITNKGMAFAWVKQKETPDDGSTPSVERLVGYKYGEGVIKKKPELQFNEILGD